MIERTATSSSPLLSRIGGRSRWVLAELLVIVIGILIALAIDAWRQGIATSKVEQQYLQQLVTDLKATEEGMHEVSAELSEYDEVARDFAAMFESDHIADLGDVRDALSVIRFMDNPVPVLATSDALVSTGDLRLISNSEIEAAVAQYLARGRDYWLVPLYQREERHRESVFRLNLLAGRYGISPGYRPGMSRNPEDSTGFPDLKGFLSDSDAYAYASRLAEDREILRGYRDGMASEASELRRLVEKELLDD